MAEISWKAKIELDISDLKQKLQQTDNELKKERKIELGIDTKKLEKAISNLDKMLDSLGKGSGDFKQFENLSKQLSSITSEVQSLSKAFGKVDSSGAKTLLSSVQNIDKSLSELSKHILDVNKNMSNMGGNTSNAVKQVENITNASKNATSALDKMAKAKEKATSGNKSGQSNIDIAQQYKEANDAVSKYEAAQNKVNKFQGNGDYSSESFKVAKKRAEDLRQAYEDAIVTLEKFNAELKNGYDGSSMDKIGVSAKELENNLKHAQEVANGSLESIAAATDKQKSSIDSAVTNTERLLQSLKKSGQNFFPSDDYNKILHSTEEELKKLKDLQSEIAKQGGLANEQQMQQFNDIMKNIKDNQEAAKNLSASQKGSTPLQNVKAIERINKALEQNTRMSAEAKAQLQAYIRELKDNPAANVKEIEAAWRAVVQAEKEAGRGGKSLFSAIDEKAFYGLAGQIASMVSLWDVINVIKQASTEVIQLNTDITDLAKVSEQSVKQIYSDFDSYADIAQEIGGTISDTISATTAWSKNGYNIPDSKELARVSLLYKNVGDDMTIDEANESLVSTLQGYKLNADQAEHIVDVFNEVSNNEAISSKGIGEALQRSAASFNAANTDLEQSVALISATNSVLQDPEKVGCKYIADIYSNVI